MNSQCQTQPFIGHLLHREKRVNKCSHKTHIYLAGHTNEETTGEKRWKVSGLVYLIYNYYLYKIWYGKI